MTPGNELALALRTAYLALHRQSNAAFAAHGVTADQFVLLATLSRGHALTQRELARRMSSDPSTVQAMLVLLERMDLVVREQAFDRWPCRTVSLTASGKKTLMKLWDAGEPVRAQMVETLSSDEIAMLASLLNRIADALNVEPTTSPEIVS